MSITSKLIKNQKVTFTRTFKQYEKIHTITATVRYDDQCGNGHNSFGITGVVARGYHKNANDAPDSMWEQCGCIHEDIAKYFPELKKYIKWHFMNSNGPLHYVANTMHHAQDTDYNGLKSGEYSAYQLHVVSNSISHAKSVTLYKTGELYTNNQNNKNLEKSNIKENAILHDFTNNLKIDYEIIKVNSEYSLSKGKTPDYKAARSCAIWPNATESQLKDKVALIKRIPTLIKQFRKDLKELNLTY